jgi:hypothetical protein
MLISRTPPSQPGSVLKRCRKESSAPCELISTDGETSSLTPPVDDGSAAKAELGAVSDDEAVVANVIDANVAVVVQPEGSVGAVTPSNDSPPRDVFGPTTNVRMKFDVPSELLRLKLSVIKLPHALAGMLKLKVRVTVDAWAIMP